MALPLFNKYLSDLYTQGIGDLVGAGISTYDKLKQGKVGEAVGGALGEVAPLPVQAALYSPEAEAAFIGPKGFARLQKAGMADKAKPFQSRFFGDRYEVSPSEAANIFWRMGSPTYAADSIRNKIPKDSYQSVKATFADFIPPEQFPELAAAYPNLFRIPVEVSRSRRDEPLKASYREPESYETPAKAYKVANKLQRRWERKNPMPNTSDYVSNWDNGGEEAYRAATEAWRTRLFGHPDGYASDAPKEYLGGLNYSEFADMMRKRALDRHPGFMTVNVPDQMNAAYPGSEIAESLLHEAQHFIQREENVKGTGKSLIDLYKTAEQVPAKKIEDAAMRSKGHTDIDGPAWDRYGDLKKSYLYNLNPYEREAFEASKRDVNPQYRQDYSRKTEKLR